MPVESTYRCPCGQALLVWESMVHVGTYHNGVCHSDRRARCPACGSAYIVRVTQCPFRPLRVLDERWFAVEPDGGELWITWNNAPHRVTTHP